MLVKDLFEEPSEKNTEKRRKEWDKATDKYRDKQTAKGQEVRIFIKSSTHAKLKARKEKMGVDQLGQVVDRLV